AIAADLTWCEDDAGTARTKLVGRFALLVADEATGTNQPLHAVLATGIQIRILGRLQSQLLVDVFFLFVGVAPHTVELGEVEIRRLVNVPHLRGGDGDEVDVLAVAVPDDRASEDVAIGATFEVLIDPVGVAAQGRQVSQHEATVARAFAVEA